MRFFSLKTFRNMSWKYTLRLTLIKINLLEIIRNNWIPILFFIQSKLFIKKCLSLLEQIKRVSFCLFVFLLFGSKCFIARFLRKILPKRRIINSIHFIGWLAKNQSIFSFYDILLSCYFLIFFLLCISTSFDSFELEPKYMINYAICISSGELYLSIWLMNIFFPSSSYINL